MEGTLRPEDVLSALTAEDRLILRYLAECPDDSAVAKRTHLSVRTVRRRIARIMALLGVQNRFAAGAAASRLGLTEPGPRPELSAPAPAAESAPSTLRSMMCPRSSQTA